MSRLIQIIAYCLLGIIFLGCSKSDIDLPEVNSITIVDTEVFSEISGTPVIDAEVIGDVLKITIASTGCDGSTWQARLVSSEGVIKTDPPKREIKIEFINLELCQAYLTKVFVFDLKPVRWSDSREVSLIIHTNGSTKVLPYKY